MGVTLALDDVTFRYGERAILSRLSLTVDEGERVVLLGPSGSGKSTVLRLLLGFLVPDAGRVLVNNVVVSSAGQLLISLAGGFLTAALLSFFFFERFGVSEAGVGLLFFGARVANAGSHLAAAWLAKRIGLVNTVVFTHIPSSLLLVSVAFAPNFAVAAVLFLLREGLVEMDVPTRQSFVIAVVRPEERTFASGVTHLVRLGAWAVAPAFAGVLMGTASLATPLLLGAAMKITYDILLYVAFRRHKPPEEQTS